MAGPVGNPFAADESFEAAGSSFIDMRTSPPENLRTRKGSLNPFISPEVVRAEEGAAELVDARLKERLQASVGDDNFRSTLPDDAFDVITGSPLFVPSPESNLVPITSEKEEILSNFRRYNLDDDEIRLISNLPDAVAKATLEELQSRKPSLGAEEESECAPDCGDTRGDEPALAASRPAPTSPEEDEGGDLPVEAVQPSGWDLPARAQALADPQPPLQSAKVDAIDDRLQHIEEMMHSLRRKESATPKPSEQELDLIKDQQQIIKAKDEAIADLMRDKEKLYLKLQDMSDEKEVSAAMSAREHTSLEEVSKIVNEYDARLEKNKSERKELLDRIEYLLGERRDFNKLESAFEALRNDNIHLQEALGEERHRSQVLIKEIRDYNQVHLEASAMCTEYKSKFEKSESDIESLKSYIVECNSANYHQRLQIEELVHENKALQAETVNLKLDLTNQQEEMARLAKEVRVLEASKQKLMLSPQKIPQATRPRDNIRIPPRSAVEARAPSELAHPPPPPLQARSPQKVILSPKSVSNIDTIENIYDRIRRGHRQETGGHHHPKEFVAAVDEREASRVADDGLYNANAVREAAGFQPRSEVKENIREAYAPQAKPSPDPAPQMAPMPPKAAKPSSKTYPYALDNDKSPTFSDEQKIERQLLKINMEKQFLESQYAKMPASSGKTLAQRKQKREIEDRLTKLNKEISSCRLTLKRLQQAAGR